MKTIPDNLTPKQAWELLSSLPPLSRESRAITKSLDYVLSEEIFAREDVPAARRSFMDGYAVRAEDVKQVPVNLKKIGEVLMGEGKTGRIGSGEAKAIPTGGFLPEGADAVVMQEDVEDLQDSVLIRKSVAPDENVQLPGEDFRKDMQLFSSKHRLRAQDLAALATFGIKRVRVYRKPRISIFSTGNELVSYGTANPLPGFIRETNSFALSSAAKKFGFIANTFGIIEDEPHAQRAAMARALEESNVVLVSGGSSVGARDYTLDVIRSFPSHKIHFHGLAIRPGNPTIFATAGDRAIFGLPGQPVSSLVVFYQFVLPFLCHLSGALVDYPQFNNNAFHTLGARLETDVRPLKIKTDYLRLRLKQTEDGRLALPVLGKSASLSTLALADGFTVVPPGEEILERGTRVIVHLFP